MLRVLWIVAAFTWITIAWPVSNRTACFKYIDCLEQAQFAFKKCSQGTVVALTLETRDKLFHTSAATQWSVVSRCQDELELDGLDFDSLQALVNEDSRECFRRMHKRRNPFQTSCEVPNFPIVPRVPQSPKACLLNFRDARKTCERLLNCCPEHVKCAERLNTLSVAYQEAKRKSVTIADKMLDCVYGSLGLRQPKKATDQGDFLRKHRGVGQDQPMDQQQPVVRFIRKERPGKNLRPVPVAITEPPKPHSYARVKTASFKMGKIDGQPIPESNDDLPSNENDALENYADKMIANNAEFQKKLEENSNEYSFGPKTTTEKPIRDEDLPREESTKKIIVNEWVAMNHQVEKKKMDELSEFVGAKEESELATERPNMEMVSTDKRDMKQMANDRDPFDTYDDGTKLDEEAIGVTLITPTTSSTSATTTIPIMSMEKKTDPKNVSFEVVQETTESHNKDNLEKMSQSGSSEINEETSTVKIESDSETRRGSQRIEIVKYLLQTADTFEAQLYLQLAAESKYDELEKIATEKKKLESQQMKPIGKTDDKRYWN